jgi:hypothetical protein
MNFQHRIGTVLPVIFSTFSVLSCWWMAITLVRAWWVPLEVDHGAWIKLGVAIMVMEFIIVHSGGFFAGLTIKTESTRKRVASFGGLIIFYSLAAYLIAYSTQSMTLLYSFGFIMLSRLLTSFHEVSGEEITSITNRSVSSALLYMIVVFLSVAIPFPSGGLTPRILNEFYPNPGDGLWQKEPQRALAAGAIYFFSIGLVELMSAKKNLASSRHGFLKN